MGTLALIWHKIVHGGERLHVPGFVYGWQCRCGQWWLG